MSNEFNINELFAVSLPEHNPTYFIGELIHRKKHKSDKDFFGKVYFEDKMSFTCTIGANRDEIERNSTELIRYSLEDLQKKLMAAHFNKRFGGRTGELN